MAFRGVKMKSFIIPIKSNMSIRSKARLNVGIARDLAASFGGKKADYLKRLNKQLKIKKASEIRSSLAKAA